MEITADSLALVLSASAAVFSAVVGFGFKISDYAAAARTRRLELYTEQCKRAYDSFITAYANLHRVKDPEDQCEFLGALYGAISVAPNPLRKELKLLLSMNSTATIKPTDENREIFYRCLDLIGEQNAKKLL